MITEDYVSFETAKLLKEKEFDEATLGGEWAIDYDNVPDEDFPEGEIIVAEWQYPLITLQMAMKWLREVHNLHIEVLITTNHLMFQWKIYRTENTSLYFAGTSLSYYEKYEEACEAGINYCLRNLI